MLSCPSQPGSRSWCWRQSSGSGTFHTARNRGECPSAGWSLGSGRCDKSHILLQGQQHRYINSGMHAARKEWNGDIFSIQIIITTYHKSTGISKFKIFLDSEFLIVIYQSNKFKLKVYIGPKLLYIQITILFQIKKWLLTDISSQHIFYLFLLKSALDHKLVITIYRTTVKEKIQNKYTEKIMPILPSW